MVSINVIKVQLTDEVLEFLGELRENSFIAFVHHCLRILALHVAIWN